jgi:hypothetical protein
VTLTGSISPYVNRTQGRDLRYRTESGTTLLRREDQLYDVLHPAQLHAYSLTADRAGARGTALTGAIEKREESYRSWQLKLVPSLKHGLLTSA